MKPYFFNLAKRESFKSTSKFRLGAVVVDKRKNVLGVAANSMTKTHTACKHLKGRGTNEDTAYPFLHAEIRALLGLRIEDTQGGSIYVYRQRKDGTIGNARPCPGCLQVIKELGIRRIYFTVDNGYKQEEVA
jgi:tRNA(Arg) A34 adenosine deaminase TadA